MKVAFRADASAAIGSGHVTRCLTLADGLRARGAEIGFACRPAAGDMIAAIEGRGYAVERIEATDEDGDAREAAACWPQRPDWIVVDHYGLGTAWERRVAPTASRLMVIDDLSDKFHLADILLNQNPATPGEQRYAGKVPDACRLLEGPRYALLRREFEDRRARLRRRDGTIRNVLVFFGGADAEGETSRALQALSGMRDRPFTIDVVVGSSNPRRRDVEALCGSAKGIRFHCDTPAMATLMADADLALGAAGSASWERCSVGLPSIVSVLADNQVPVARALVAAGTGQSLGWYDKISGQDYVAAIAAMTPARLDAMQDAALALVDARGTERVVAAMLNGDSND